MFVCLFCFVCCFDFVAQLNQINGERREREREKCLELDNKKKFYLKDTQRIFLPNGSSFFWMALI